MALAFTIKQRNRVGNQKKHTVDIAFDDSYQSGGEAATAANFGLTVVNDVVFPEPTGGYVFQYDRTNSLIHVYRSAGATPAGTISKPTFTVEASGSIGSSMEVGFSADSAAATFEGGTGITAQRVLTTTSPVGTPTFTGTAIAAGALVEVAGAVDLSALTAVRAIATGR
jgi:hypothetical protein